jgi:hypothetical protein
MRISIAMMPSITGIKSGKLRIAGSKVNEAGNGAGGVWRNGGTHGNREHAIIADPTADTDLLTLILSYVHHDAKAIGISWDVLTLQTSWWRLPVLMYRLYIFLAKGSDEVESVRLFMKKPKMLR